MINIGDTQKGVLAFTHASGVPVTTYTYAPFGETAVSGAASPNPFQFTGREDDGSGLYYYRARYYDPVRSRFVSEDPIGLLGGDLNYYVYTRDRPTSLLDPSGLRNIYVAVWNRNPGENSVGHVAALETDGRVILSQFPLTRARQNPNTLLDWQQTLVHEGRNPDVFLKVYVPDDARFDEVARNRRDRPTWDWLPTKTSQTNCVESVGAALRAGGVPVGSYWWPGNLGAELLQKIGQGGQPWAVMPPTLREFERAVP
jgi:RHS repeat-associated protein